jgi:3-phosphoshikimate 1-carboxyvinyltransferase
MHQRPIDGLTDALQVLGAGVEFPGEEGYPPLVIHAQGLRGGQVEFKVPQSSQWISALMLVAPYAQKELFLTITGETPSLPYLKMTVAVMEAFGVGVIAQYQESDSKFIVDAPQRYQARHFEIEPDASNASYFLAAPAVAGGQITIDGLGDASIQGDVRFVDVLERMGCVIDRQPHRLTVRRPAGLAKLRALDIDLNDMPDMVMTLAVLALFADGPTTIRNVRNLRIKETDRLSALASELQKLGAKVNEEPDGLCIDPPETLKIATLQTYNDHRMAMSFALAGLRHDGITIENPGCCAKTFPDFFDRFDRMARAEPNGWPTSSGAERSDKGAESP